MPKFILSTSKLKN